MYDQERDVPELVCLTQLEARALLKLLMHNDFADPTYKRVAADLGEKLLREGVR